jgi:lysophospholipase L1-like esterase
METYCAKAQYAGFKVVLLNVTPRSTPEDFNAKAVDCNALLAADWTDYADAYLDLYSDPLIGIGADQPGTYYDDNAHMTAAGYGVVAGLVKTAIEGLL